MRCPQGEQDHPLSLPAGGRLASAGHDVVVGHYDLLAWQCSVLPPAHYPKMV
jgi:hypothetical protein